MSKKNIWFDLDNSPHVPLFRPVFNELKNREIEFKITARNFAQTQDLLNFWNINYIAVGSHGGKNKLKKIFNLFHRAYQLKKALSKYQVNLAVSHGSRSQLITAKWMGIPSVIMLDYEYTESKIFNYLSTYLLIPKYIPAERLIKAGFNLKKIIRYNGFKEELYLNYFKPEIDFREKIGVTDDQILIVIRPPGITGNYHNEKSENLLIEALRYFSSFSDTIILIVNRTAKEKKFITSNFKLNEKVKFLDKPVNGLQLLYSADISVSGGGTMNREASLLGTETYSIFTGKKPYLDEYLQMMGKLKFLQNIKEFQNIRVERKRKSNNIKFTNDLVNEITDIFLNISNQRQLVATK
jgi:hypothetical protein